MLYQKNLSLALNLLLENLTMQTVNRAPLATQRKIAQFQKSIKSYINANLSPKDIRLGYEKENGYFKIQIETTRQSALEITLSPSSIVQGDMSVYCRFVEPRLVKWPHGNFSPTSGKYNLILPRMTGLEEGLEEFKKHLRPLLP
mgnify:CR=1 FL=1